MKSGKKNGKRLGRGLEALLGNAGDKIEGVEDISDKVTGDTRISDQREVISDQLISDQKGVTSDHPTESQSDETKDESKGENIVSRREEGVVVKLSDVSVTMISDKLSSDVIERAVEDGKKNPRVVVWSPVSSIVLRILKKTIPEFSVSKEAASLLEDAIKKKYPDIWKIAEEKLGSNY